jgi:hypothetical protein
MRCEPLDIRHRAGMIETAIEAIHQMPAGDGETVRGDAPRVVAIAQRERLLEHRDKSVLRLILGVSQGFSLGERA